ncbi:tetratricopeptide repeat protein [Allokutzneria sp. A3M-2-11 16]|uniref:tetratricopeptide repeat protein n=1 Tax=Allokutzneria sp. A3M-2-11 16 TaxID=2962043 RepID=UPI0020B6B698|nr:tetratricopeptide repeat protein [Allokutzneria sp. A3M-2-11 16]MCP3802892.1 tetratricopeptide repeat protein [Allokutzneria sp. A3M-2-11 16]
MSETIEAGIERITAARAAGRHEDALALAVELAERYPDDARVAYQAGWAHDKLGKENDAVPYYSRALSLPGLTPVERHGVFLGLGSTYRTLGRYEESLETLRRGVAEFPDFAPLKAFLAMTLYNCGENKEAVSMLLNLVLDTTDDASVKSYSEAIALYARDLDQVWDS